MGPHAPPPLCPPTAPASSLNAAPAVITLQAGEVTLPPKGELFYLSQRPCEFGYSWEAGGLQPGPAEGY